MQLRHTCFHSRSSSPRVSSTAVAAQRWRRRLAFSARRHLVHTPCPSRAGWDENCGEPCEPRTTRSAFAAAFCEWTLKSAARAIGEGTCRSCFGLSIHGGTRNEDGWFGTSVPITRLLLMHPPQKCRYGVARASRCTFARAMQTETGQGARRRGDVPEPRLARGLPKGRSSAGLCKTAPPNASAAASGAADGLGRCDCVPKGGFH